MATKPGKVVIHNEELPSIKSHDFLIKWFSNSRSSGLDFSCTICRFRTQMPKLSPTTCFMLKCVKYGDLYSDKLFKQDRQQSVKVIWLISF